MSTTRLPIANIRRDGGTQPRAAISADVVSDYADAMTEGAEFPAVVTFYDGQEYWLADGFHRVAAAEKLGWREVDAEVRQGTRRDAVLHSVGANGSHGLRRTNADKRRAVETLLNDAEWGKWSAGEIARKCNVSHDFAARMKKESSLSSDDSEPRTFTDRHGNVTTMNTANIGKRAEAPAPLSPGTVDDTRPTDRAPMTDKPVTITPQRQPTTSPTAQDDATSTWLMEVKGRVMQIKASRPDMPDEQAIFITLAEHIKKGRITLNQ